MKKALLSLEVLALPRKEAMFVLDTDASNVAVGGILFQYARFESEANSLCQ